LVLIIAGEASADLHGSNLVKAMKRMDPGIAFWGIGGERMRQAGVRILIAASDMAVMGLTEVLPRLRTIARAATILKTVLREKRPDLLILIDYPEFNIHLARTANKKKVPVLYYISPQVWAWRRGRVGKIARRVDRMASILPFEKSFYSRTDLKVDYVGHPIMDTFPEGAESNPVARDFILGRDDPVVAIVPGSRKEEIRNLLPVMVRSAERLKKRYPRIRYLLPLAPTVTPELVNSFLRPTGLEIGIVQGTIYDALSHAHLALVTSGTATLETAISGVPMVIAYKGSRISYWIAKKLVRVPYISLVNLVAGERVATELIQDDATPEQLTREAILLLEDRTARTRMLAQLDRIRNRLGQGGASNRTAEIALEMVGR
jgi:lipid-A-disaccharide synthase